MIRNVREILQNDMDGIGRGKYVNAMRGPDPTHL